VLMKAMARVISGLVKKLVILMVPFRYRGPA